MYSKKKKPTPNWSAVVKLLIHLIELLIWIAVEFGFGEVIDDDDDDFKSIQWPMAGPRLAYFQTKFNYIILIYSVACDNCVKWVKKRELNETNHKINQLTNLEKH